MPAVPLLSPAEIDDAMQTVKGWELIGGTRLQKVFRFADFADAFAFMTRLAPVADELDHHPEWSNVYNQVTIELTTHDVDGLTKLDFEFARRAQLAEIANAR